VCVCVCVCAYVFSRAIRSAVRTVRLQNFSKASPVNNLHEKLSKRMTFEKKNLGAERGAARTARLAL